MSWHCEDAAINWTELPAVTREWHDDRRRALRARSDVFDDWGMFAYTSARTGVDYLTEIDVGIWEQELDDETWAMWVEAKRDIAAVAVAHGGSISACHGACREGEVDVVPDELGGGYDVMHAAQAHARPEQRHEPGQVRARRRVRGGPR